MPEEAANNYQHVIKAFQARRFDPVIFVHTAEEAKKAALDMIPEGARVSMGGSTTLRQIGLVDELKSNGLLTMTGAEVFMTSSNVITEDGKLLNTDMTGNRVSGMIFGHKQVIAVVGINKLVKDREAGLDRLRNLINPYLSKSAGLKNPCAVDGKCHDCISPTRVCSVTTILEAKPRVTNFAIILVGEDLGLGWDPDWNEERKDKIAGIFKEKWAEMIAARAG